MIDISSASLTALYPSFVGNMSCYEGVVAPSTHSSIDSVTEEVVLGGILPLFAKKTEEFYFYGEPGPEDNHVFRMIRESFQHGTIYKGTMNSLCQLLYESTEWSKAGGGEFICCLFDNIMVDGECVKAFAMVRTSEKVNFLESSSHLDRFNVSARTGIDFKKITTAALIVELDEESGYRVLCIDRKSKPGDVSYWKDRFMVIRPSWHNYFNTKHYISAAAEYLNTTAPHQMSLSPTEKLDAILRAKDFFNDSEEFDIANFEEVVIPSAQPGYFEDYMHEYATAMQIGFETRFKIDPNAVREMSKLLDTTYHLDKNFTVKVAGRADLVEFGYDEEKGRKFLKLFYDQVE